MLFNSIDFAVFLPIVFILYWFVTNRHLKLQNVLIVVASYVFYGWWDWRFLILIFVSTFVDYWVGVGLSNEENQNRRKGLLWISIVVNLGILVFFKYSNFFIESFAAVFSLFGAKFRLETLNIILPVGISFYTFQSLSYSIDVYKRKFEPAKDFMVFTAYVSFFPQLVAGPIERASHLLPQFYTQRKFDYTKAVDGTRQILWGLFKKMVIADNCAFFVNQAFDCPDSMNGSALLIGVVLFSAQVYGDFSGYSDIAIGTARLFGFELMQNFAYPFFSRNISEFWKRWHISMTTWFRDYIYIPLGGSRGSIWMRIRNTFIVFVFCGFWHGANWNYIVFGCIMAIYFLPLIWSGSNRKYQEVVAKGKALPSLKEVGQMFRTFLLFVFSMIVFRSVSLNRTYDYMQGIFSASIFEVPNFSDLRKIVVVIALTVVFFVVEWIGREGQYALEAIGLKWNRPYRWAMYYIIVLAIFLLGGETQQFIYFQF